MLTDSELEIIKGLAEDKFVLEIGTLTTFTLAATGKRVDSVDTFMAFQSLLLSDPFVTSYSNIAFHVGTSSFVVPMFIPNFDLVFIDTRHSTESAWKDLDLAFDKVKFGGTIIIHEPILLTAWLEERCTFLMKKQSKDEKGFITNTTEYELHAPEVHEVDSLVWFVVNWR
jgi:Methyltransferase domain